MLHQETLLALLALVFGRAGRQDVPVGRALVPVGAFPNAIRVLADQVSGEQFARVGRQAQTQGLRYMMDAEGSYVGDPADPAARTGRLLELLQQADAETMRARSAEAAWQTAEFQESLAEDYEVDVEAEAFEAELEAFEAEPEAVDDWFASSLPAMS